MIFGLTGALSGLREGSADGEVDTAGEGEGDALGATEPLAEGEFLGVHPVIVAPATTTAANHTVALIRHMLRVRGN